MIFELTGRYLNKEQQRIVNRFACLLVIKPNSRILLSEEQYDELLKAFPEDSIKNADEIRLTYKGVSIVKL